VPVEGCPDGTSGIRSGNRQRQRLGSTLSRRFSRGSRATRAAGGRGGGCGGSGGASERGDFPLQRESERVSSENTGRAQARLRLGIRLQKREKKKKAPKRPRDHCSENARVEAGTLAEQWSRVSQPAGGTPDRSKDKRARMAVERPENVAGGGRWRTSSPSHPCGGLKAIHSFSRGRESGKPHPGIWSAQTPPTFTYRHFAGSPAPREWPASREDGLPVANGQKTTLRPGRPPFWGH